MKSFILSIILIAVMQFSFGQDKPVKYSKVITVNSLNKNELFDKVLFWFNRSFYNDQDKIKVNNREAGILSGQATFYSAYRIPKNSDSTAGVDFANYSLEWTIKINNNRIAFDVTKIYLNGTIPVTTTTKSPRIIFFQSEEQTDNDWKLSKTYLMNNLDALTSSLHAELNNRNSSLAGL